MFGGNFQTWKLHSAQDYFMFFAYILAGVMVFWLIAKHMNKQRNHEKAVEKVSARLKKICGKPGEVLKNATLNLPEGKMTFDAVLMDKRGVYLVRTYGWGIKIYGTPDGAMWRREDAKRKEEFENPLLELKKGAQVMFVKNDSSGEHRYYNGMIGEVTDLSADSIEVRAKDSTATFLLQEEEWANAKYVLDEESKEIVEDIEGTFRQFPLKLPMNLSSFK